MEFVRVKARCFRGVLAVLTSTGAVPQKGPARRRCVSLPGGVETLPLPP